jgi:hypothetical protein
VGDAPSAQGRAKRATIIAAIRHQFLWSLSGTSARPCNRDSSQGRCCESNLGTRSARQVEAERQSVSISNEHPLRAFAPARQTNSLTAPFGRDKRAVKEGPTPIERAALVERGQRRPPDALPDTFFAPAFEPSPRRRGRAVYTRQILPAAAGDEDVEDAFDSPPVVGAGPPCVRRGREVRTDESPLLVREVDLAHVSRLVHSLLHWNRL